VSENQKSILVDLCLGLVIAIAIFFWKSGSEYPLLHLLSDSTFVSAVVLLGMGGLRLCVNSGSLDMLGYGFSTLQNNLRNIGKIEGGPKETYYEYSQRVAEERKPCGHYLIAGAVFLVAAIGFLVAYEMM
jgi:hypothetical protein